MQFCFLVLLTHNKARKCRQKYIKVGGYFATNLSVFNREQFNNKIILRCGAIRDGRENHTGKDILFKTKELFSKCSDSHTNLDSFSYEEKGE